jgi:hypothetical protein
VGIVLVASVPLAQVQCTSSLVFFVMTFHLHFIFFHNNILIHSCANGEKFIREYRVFKQLNTSLTFQTTSTPPNAASLLGKWATTNSYCGVVVLEVVTKSQDPSNPDSATYYLGASQPGYSPAVIVPQLQCVDYSG